MMFKLYGFFSAEAAKDKDYSGSVYLDTKGKEVRANILCRDKDAVGFENWDDKVFVGMIWSWLKIAKDDKPAKIEETV